MRAAARTAQDPNALWCGCVIAMHCCCGTAAAVLVVQGNGRLASTAGMMGDMTWHWRCCCSAADLPLQPAQPGEPWQVPPHSSNGSFKAGCVLTLQPASSAALAQQQSTAAEQPQQQQHQVVLNCIDSQGFIIGSLLQQEVLEALEFAGHWQPQQQAQAVDSGQQQQAPMLADASEAAMQQLDWQQWRAVVKSVKRASEQQLAAVVVRLVPQQQAS